MNVILYTTHCPKCRILESKLKQKNIPYKTIEDVEIIKQKGFITVPMLEVENTIMDFTTANKWINEYRKDE